MPDVVGRLRPPRLAGAPASPAVGELYYNTGNNALYYWNGTAWAGAGVGASGPAGGDLKGTYPNPTLNVTALTGSLGSNTSLGVNTNTVVLQTASLAVGTWLIVMGLVCVAGSAGAIEAWADTAGTATATISGKTAGGADVPASSSMAEISLNFLATVTSAGTLRLIARGTSGTSSTVLAATRVNGLSPSTAWSALKIG